MQTLTPTLEAAQKSQGRQEPAVVVSITAEPVEWPWLEAPQLVADEGLADCAHWAACSLAGTIHRVRVSASGQLYRQRVTDPDNASPAAWTTWTSMGGGCQPGGPVCLCADDASNTVWLFFTLGGGRTVYCRKSGDDGASFASATTVISQGSGAVRALAASARAGQCHCFVGYDPGGTDPDDYVLAVPESGGAWGAPVAETGRRHALKWLSAPYQQLADGSWVVGVYVCDGSPRRISLLDYSPGTSSFGGGAVIWESAAGSGFDYEGIGVQERSDNQPRYLWAWVERNSLGSGYRRLKLCLGPSRNFVTEVMTFDYGGGGYGVRAIATAGYGYLIASTWARRMKAYSGASGETVDASDSLCRLEVVEAGERPGGGEVWLDNHGGRYTGAGEGDLLALRPGSRVRLGLGYRTASGIETVWQPPRWIESLSYVEHGDGEGYLVLRLLDAWGHLQRTRAFRQEESAGRNLSSILSRAASRVTGQHSSDLHPNLNRTVARYIVSPGQAWGDVAREMGRAGGLLLRFRTDPVASDGRGWDSVALECVPAGGGVAAYQYGFGPGEHPWRRLEDGPATSPVQHVEVYGEGAFGEAWDLAAAYALGRQAVQKVRDLQITSDAEAAARAEWELNRSQLLSCQGQLVAAPNLGLEVFDLIEIRDRWGNVAGLRQVSRLRTVLDRRTGEYWQTVGYWGA